MHAEISLSKCPALLVWKRLSNWEDRVESMQIQNESALEYQKRDLKINVEMSLSEKIEIVFFGTSRGEKSLFEDII